MTALIMVQKRNDNEWVLLSHLKSLGKNNTGDLVIYHTWWDAMLAVEKYVNKNEPYGVTNLRPFDQPYVYALDTTNASELEIE